MKTRQNPWDNTWVIASGVVLLIALLLIFSSSPFGEFMLRQGGIRNVYSIPKYEVLKIDFTVASNNYNNPFTDVTLTATFTSPSNRVLVIDGFYNGDGSGGQSGNVWSLRFSGDELGTWLYVTSSDDPSLNGLEGTVDVTQSGNQGPVIVDAQYSHWFKFKEGENVHLHGNFLDSVAGGSQNPLKFTHLYLSEAVTEQQRQQYISRAHQIKTNKMNIYIANKCDYQGDWGSCSSFPYHTTPWLGTYNSNDKMRFDLSRWWMYENEIARLVQEGIIAEFWFLADDSAFGSMSDTQIEHLLKYGMARFSAYPNVMFVQILEWEEAYGDNAAGRERANRYGNFMQQHNPFGRLVSIHGTTGNFDFPDEEWATFMATQAGNSVTYQNNYLHTLTNFNLPSSPKPLINEEFGFNNDDQDITMRRKLWMAFAGGAAGTGSGSGTAQFDDFFALLNPEFWKMIPDDNVMQSAGADSHCLAETGVSYICYEPVGGTLTLRASEITYEYNYAWFDPRQGTIAQSGTIGPGNLVLSPPYEATSDWVLYLRRGSGVPSCSLTADPSEGTGPFDSILTAVFENLPPETYEALMKCSSDDTGTLEDISENIATKTCSYPAVDEITIFTPGAIAGEAQCSAAVTDNPVQPENIFSDDYVQDIYSNPYVDHATIDNIVWDYASSYYPLGGEVPPDSQGIKAIWHFNDDISDGIADDASGNGNEGFCEGTQCPAYTTSGQQLGAGAYIFDGVDDRIEVPAGVLSTEGTVAMWIKPAAMNSQTIFDATNDIGSNKQFFIDINDAGLLRFKFEDASDADFVASYNVGSLPQNEWYHVAGVWRYGASPSVELYLNSQPVASDPRISGTMPALATPYIGFDRSVEDTNTRWKFSGIIDEVAVWERALSQQDIAALYSGGPAQGSFESISMNIGEFSSIYAEWSESSDFVDIQISDGTSWCTIDNGQILDENTCPFLPADSLKYKALFSDYSLLNSIYFEWAQGGVEEPDGGGKSLPYEQVGYEDYP